MSFYDSASLVFLPSGGAGKDGKAYSIKPVPEYGNELVTNGGFDTNSDWTFIGSANIANGVVNFITSGDFVIQSNVVSLSVETYKIQYEVVSSNNGQLRFAGGNSAFPVTTLPSSVGVHTVIVVSNGTQGSLQFNSNGFIGSIDNVSVKEVIVDGDFTFSRGSNLTATRIDSNGLIEKGRENLLTYSNDFSTWSKVELNTTPNQADPFGENTATLITTTGTTFGWIRQQPTNTGVQTISFYVKAGSNTKFTAGLIQSPYPQTTFTLTGNGAKSSNAGVIDSTITLVGNGWYRCSMSYNMTSSHEIRFYPNDTINKTIGDSVYIFGFQLEQGLVATEYIESGATTGKAGILEDSPRFDYSGGASCPSLLLEPSRTNVITYSEYFDGWNKGRSSVTSNAAVSPDGLVNASYFYDNTESGTHRLYSDTFSVTSGQSQSLTLYAKTGTFDKFRISVKALNESDLAFGIFDFDLTAGTCSNSDGSIESMGNGWYKCTAVGNVNASVSARMFIYLINDSDAVVYVGTGNDYIQIYGAQCESNVSYPTSYIPNHSGGSVTREADANTLLNQSGVIGQTAGTILFDAYFDEADKVNFSISDSTSSNYILIDTTSGKQVFARVQQGGSTQATISTSGSFFTEGDRLKCAIAYDDRDMAFYINGTQVGTATPNLIPACDDIRFTRWNGALAYAADQRVNRVVLFPTRVSNTDLEILTGTSYESFAAMATALNYTTYE